MRTPLSKDQRSNVIFEEDKALVPVTLAAKLLNTSRGIIESWPLAEKYPNYSPKVYNLYDLVSVFSSKKVKLVDKLKAEISKLIDEKVDWTQNLKKEQTKMTALKNAQLEGELISFEHIDFYLLGIAQRFFSAIDDVPARLSPKLIGIKTRKEAYLLLEEEMRNLRVNLGQLCMDNYKALPVDLKEECPDGFAYDKKSDTFIREDATLS